MDSVSSKQQKVTRPLICPYARFRNEEDEFRWVQFGELPIQPSFLDSKVDKSNNSVEHDKISLLDQCNNKEGTPGDVQCNICWKNILIGTTFFSCKHCDNRFHKECTEPISNHPYHPKHSLRFKIYHPYWEEPRTHYYRCSCCSLRIVGAYNCSICNFTMCRDCAKKPPVLAIDHPKRHEHPLLYFLRKESSLTCDVCALSHSRSSIYACPQCHFVVHRECVYLPWIIRISRHQHHLSFDSSLTPHKWSCGVCRGKIDTDYGRYSCMKGCSYGVHSKCATREDVWDGKELEGEPEDAYEEELKSFSEVSDRIIQHFSHQNHHMRLDEETDREFDENKRCQACTLPICDDIIYSCMQCDDFILHQACAHLPRKKKYPMHPHPLTLQVYHLGVLFDCDACLRANSGFNYECRVESCYYKLDIRCAFISEPFNYQCHPHPLFLTSRPRSQQECLICHSYADRLFLNCGECGFVLCFGCATLPGKLRYKHDEHFLFFFYDKDASGEYWCDVCENEADPKKNGIYMCNDCDVTLHIKCLLGEEEMYLMSGRVFEYWERYVEILSNNHLTRNICRQCDDRCQGKIVYKTFEGTICCSIKCVIASVLY